jgi:glutathione-independent formaldehyde dehydrogenase
LDSGVAKKFVINPHQLIPDVKIASAKKETAAA